MKALILAAGEGTRLRPLTLTTPKPMLPIVGQPLLHHIFTWLRAHQIAQVTVNLHHLSHIIRGSCGSGERWGITLRYLYEPELLGSAGTIFALGQWFDRTLVVVYGDVLTDLNLSRLLAFHYQSRAVATLSLYRVSNPTECGIVALDRQGYVTDFVEKPHPDAVFSNLANAGVLVFEPEIRAFLSPYPNDIGQDLLPRLLAAGLPVAGLPLSEDEYLIEIGAPAKYLRAQNDASAGRVKLPWLRQADQTGIAELQAGD